MQYAEYALWQRRWLAGEVLKRRSEYWLKMLAGFAQTMSRKAPKDEIERRATLIADPKRVEHSGPAVSVPKRHETVATVFPFATGAGLEILCVGGNAIDAGMAAAWIFCVSEPSASGLGGQFVLLVRFADGRNAALTDGRPRVPAVASLGTIKAGEQRRGHRACTIPSTLATLDCADRNTAYLAGKWWNIARLRQIAFFPVLAPSLTCESFANVLDRDEGFAAVWRFHDGVGGSDHRALRFPELVQAGCISETSRFPTVGGSNRSPLGGRTGGARGLDHLIPDQPTKSGPMN
ncbi:gamma-glutamyltransferase [Mesorhizobium sp. M0119]|uniref:gamma-glutamyltransferase n=1 Tax=Mesorhizobium sp. M0119 TaxID=2956885 RepID=UPI00333CF340